MSMFTWVSTMFNVVDDVFAGTKALSGQFRHRCEDWAEQDKLYLADVAAKAQAERDADKKKKKKEKGA